jgi:hypothetical protein
VYACEHHGDNYYIGTAEGSIAIIDSTGKSLLQIRTPVVRILKYSSFGLLAGMVDGSVTCYDNNLSTKWKYKTGSWIKSICPTSDRVFIGSADHCVYLLDLKGTCIDSYETGYSVLSVDTDDDNVVAGSADGHTYVFKRKHAIIIPNTLQY